MERLIVPLGIVTYASALTGFAAFFWPGDSTTISSTVFLISLLAMITSTIVALVSSYRESVREERARMRWVLGTLALGFSGLAALLIITILKGPAAWAQYLSLTILAIPFGLGYVILRHRVIDIGFVVNRAVVYTCVSVVVVGAFIVFEWLVAHVVEANSRASAVIQLFGALALGLSVRFIHTRVDKWVDDLFFRDRHQAEAAIRRFAHETGMITDPDVLIERTVDVAQRNGRLSAAAFYGRLGSSYVPLHSTFENTPAVDENDEAVLQMRTFHHPVDVHADSSLPGYAAFPMIVRGGLSGFLVCGEKTTHEAPAPDERDAMRVLARDAGIALDSLRISRIEQELAYLSSDGELPAAVRMRLSSLLHREDGSQPAGAAARSIK